MISKRFLLMGGAVLTTELIWYLYRRFGSFEEKTWIVRAVWKTNARKSKQNISKVMFFSNESNLCRAHASSDEICLKDCCPVRYLREVESYINRAERSLDVCMYMLSCQLLSNAIVNAHKRGVFVRIIMDRHMASNESAQTALFYNNGVPIRLKDLGVLMHHKFAIVDNDIVITGSMNWTMSGFFGNFENLLVTNHRLLLQPFIDEFDSLWKTFSNFSNMYLEPLIEPLVANSGQ